MSYQQPIKIADVGFLSGQIKRDAEMGRTDTGGHLSKSKVYKWPARIWIRQISLRSRILKMNSKISLILFGLLVTLAVLAAAENSEENSLSEEVSSSRLARSADADAGSVEM